MWNWTLGIIGLLIGLYILLFFAIYAFQEILIFKPLRLPDDHRFEFEHDFEELDLYPEAGVRLNALHFRTENPKGVILYFHGNAGSLKEWGWVSDLFVDLGYDLFIYDYRGFGKSRGEKSEKALFSDAEYIYKHLKEQYNEADITLYGRSLGTGIAARLAARNDPQRLILETPYYSFIDLADHHFPWIPHSWLLNYPIQTNKFIRHVRCPVYIFHGDQDRIVYYHSSVKLKKHLKPGDRLFTIKGGRHNDLEGFPEYHRRLREVLEGKWLPEEKAEE